MRFNPFNPQMPARPDFFVGREIELKQFEQNLLQTINDAPMNISINGNRGMGKTSLLAKMEEIGKGHGCLVFRMSNYEGNLKDIVSLTEYLILGVKRELFANQLLRGKMAQFGEWIVNLRPQITYKDVDLTFKEKEMAAQTILRDNFLRLWEKVKGDYSAIVLLIDEAEALERIKEDALSFLRETFQQLSYDSRYMIVLSGKLNFPQRMSESFSPLNRFFPTYALENLSESEVKEYLVKKLATVNVTAEEEAIKKIYEMSEGHPYVTVAIASDIFGELKEEDTRIRMTDFTQGREKAMATLERDFFLPMFHPLSRKSKEIIIEIAKHAEKRDFFYKDAVKFCNSKRTDVSPFIQEAVRKGVLNKPERAHYEFFHSLFLEFLKKRAESHY